MIRDKKLGIEIAENEEEAYWNEVVHSAIDDIHIASERLNHLRKRKSDREIVQEYRKQIKKQKTNVQKSLKYSKWILKHAKKELKKHEKPNKTKQSSRAHERK